jgi:hypothetical protein
MRHREPGEPGRRLDARARPNEKRRRRVCLRCDHPFTSEGPQHRLCNPCTESQRQLSSPEPVYSLQLPRRS